MGTVNVWIQKNLDDISGAYLGGAGNVIGNVQSLDRAGPKAPRAARSMLFAVGGRRSTKIRLPRGRYLIDATLPSGDLASGVVDVPYRGQIDVYLDLEHSPHEWLSWQHLAGNVGLRSLDDLDFGRVGGQGLTGAAQVPWVIQEPVALEHADQPLATPGGTPSMRGRIPLDQFAAAAGDPPRRMVNRDGPYASYVLSSSRESDVRWYVDVETGFGNNVLVVLPMPWIDTTTGKAVDIDILITHGGSVVDAQGTISLQTDCSIVVRDSMMSTVIGYLASGETVAANKVFRQAELAVLLKRQNAIAAAAGGYVLLAGDGRRQRTPDLAVWTGNLAKWFKWLPDGAIQRAWLSLRSSTKADQSVARGLVLDAYYRGIPFYSEGVRILRDSLVILSNRHSGDPEVEIALQAARRLALQIDPTRAFTTLRSSAADRRASLAAGLHWTSTNVPSTERTYELR